MLQPGRRSRPRIAVARGYLLRHLLGCWLGRQAVAAEIIGGQVRRAPGLLLRLVRRERIGLRLLLRGGRRQRRAGRGLLWLGREWSGWSRGPCRLRGRGVGETGSW